MKKCIVVVMLISANFLLAQKLNYNPQKQPIQKISEIPKMKQSSPNKNYKIVLRNQLISLDKQPLIILNGNPISYQDFKNINSDKIISLDVIKEEKATELFGGKAKNGVIVIKTKKILKPQKKQEKQKQDILAI